MQLRKPRIEPHFLLQHDGACQLAWSIQTRQRQKGMLERLIAPAAGPRQTREMPAGPCRRRSTTSAHNLEILALRMGPRAGVDDRRAVRASAALPLPPMLLQPVENAIATGLETKVERRSMLAARRDEGCSGLLSPTRDGLAKGATPLRPVSTCQSAPARLATLYGKAQRPW